MAALVAMGLAVTVGVGAWAGGLRGACLLAAAPVPPTLLNAPFFLGTDPNAWVLLFAAAIVAIWTASGAWLDLLVRRFSRAAEELTTPSGSDRPAG